MIEQRIFPDVIGQWHWEVLLDGWVVASGVCRTRRAARRRARFITRALGWWQEEKRRAERRRYRERDLNANGC